MGLVAVLLFLASFAIVAATTTKRSADDARRSAVVTSAYERARTALTTQSFWMNEYLVQLVGRKPGSRPATGGRDGNAAQKDGMASARTPAEMRKLHGEAAARLVAALSTVRRHGDRGDRVLAQRLLEHYQGRSQAQARMFAAVDRGDAQAALSLRARASDPDISNVERVIDEAARSHRDMYSERLASLGERQRTVYLGTLVAFSIGLGLVALFTAILHAYGRRIEASRAAEVARLKRAAFTDNLTDLRNHRAFHEELVGPLLEATPQSPVSLLMIDLDGLKQVNDRYGHQIGDERLKALADCLRTTVRDDDAIYRLGGDEFAVILHGEKAWGGFRLMQRVLERLAESDPGIPLTASAGIAEAGGPMDKEMLIRRADLALLEAKRSDRSALIYSEDLEATIRTPERRAEEHYLQTLSTALARAVDAKDSYTRSHCETVAETCALIAAELGFEPARVAKMRLAGLLHDVGKIGIADAILQKPTTLTEEEFDVMRTHSVLGYRIVSGADLEEEADWILHHHERLDGRGYPHGLRGEELPLESRIILVADTFEAMTADRPYRKATSEERAFAELERYSGTQFDPVCVAALRSALSGRPAPAPADGAEDGAILAEPVATSLEDEYSARNERSPV